MSTRVNYSALAEEMANDKRDDYLVGFGADLDFSPPSILALDAFLTEMYGEGGEARDVSDYEPSKGKQGMIIAFGSYFGETIRRLFGGTWHEDATNHDNPLWASVELPSGLHVMAIAKVFKRLKNGNEDSLFPLYMSVREQISPGGLPGEGQAFFHYGDEFEKKSHLPASRRAAVTASFFRYAAALDPALKDAAVRRYEKLEKAAHGEPSIDTEPLMKQAEALGNAGQAQEAIALYEQIVAAVPDHVEARRQLAIGLAMSGRLEESLKHFDTILAMHRDDRQVLKVLDNKATTVARMGCFVDAIALFDRVLALTPDEPSTWKRRSFCLEKLGRMAEALAGYVKATELDPAYAEAWVFRGFTARKLGKKDEALQSLKQALQTVKPGSLPRELITEVRRAIVELENPGRELDPQAATALRDRAYELLNGGQPQPALDLFERSLDLDPTSWEAWHNQGAALQALGRREQAVASFRRALDIEPGLPPTWTNLARTLHALERRDEALEAYDQAIALAPDDEKLKLQRFACEAHAFRGKTAPGKPN